MIAGQHHRSGERLVQCDLLDSGVAYDADKGSERGRRFLIRADEQHRFLGVAASDVLAHAARRGE